MELKRNRCLAWIFSASPWWSASQPVQRVIKASAASRFPRACRASTGCFKSAWRSLCRDALSDRRTTVSGSVSSAPRPGWAAMNALSSSRVTPHG